MIFPTLLSRFTRRTRFSARLADRIGALAAAAALGAAWPAAAAPDKLNKVDKVIDPPAVAAEEAPNNTWVSITGTVTSTTSRTFLLDYGDGVITVEMDDFDAFAEAHQIFDNDKVIVFGRVDEDLFETRRIEAASVFVEGLGTFFHANPIDEEDFHR